MMRIHRHADAGQFLSSADAWLLDAEPENNLIIGVARRSRRHEPVVDDYWATVYEGDRIVGAAFRTPPYPVGMTRMPADAIPVLLDDLEDAYRALPGVVGPTDVAELFARQWCARNGSSWRNKFRQRIHVLTMPADVGCSPPGQLRSMTDGDETLIRQWMAAFVRDVGVSAPPDGYVQSLLDERKFFLWDDDGPRCMVAAGRDSPSGACITAVYTPPAHRRRGYATAATAALSRNLLSGGKRFCCLYTDLSNPTSNAIYAKIGYEPVRDDVELVFDPALSP